jgi:hypothetical protein
VTRSWFRSANWSMPLVDVESRFWPNLCGWKSLPVSLKGSWHAPLSDDWMAVSTRMCLRIPSEVVNAFLNSFWPVLGN